MFGPDERLALFLRDVVLTHLQVRQVVETDDAQVDVMFFVERAKVGEV